MTHTEGLHHYHKKKRAQKKEPFHSNAKFEKFMDKTIYFVGIFGPLMTIPQLIKIFYEKNAVGVSAISWLGYSIAALFWISYGIMHKEKPIIFTYLLWFVLDIVIVIGALIYG